ncbi:NADP-dependent oxidoreductase [Kribbella sp. NPDC054772]
MRAITVRDRDADDYGLSLTELPSPTASENDVVVEVHAAGFLRGEPEWPSTWTDRAGRDRTPSVLGHELSGVVVELGYGTTGLTVGQRVFGLTDWARNGSLAEQAAVETRNLAPLPADIDHVAAAAVVMPGLTAWQALYDHGHLEAGRPVLIHGAGGSVGSVAVQLARETGAHIIGTGRAADRALAGSLGVHEFVDLGSDRLEDVGAVDVVFDVIGGEIRDRSTALLRPGGTVVSVAEPPTVQPSDGRSIFFVVEPNREQLTQLAARLRDGRLTPLVTAVHDLATASAAFTEHTRGRSIITMK